MLTHEWQRQLNVVAPVIFAVAAIPRAMPTVTDRCKRGCRLYWARCSPCPDGFGGHVAWRYPRWRWPIWPSRRAARTQASVQAAANHPQPPLAWARLAQHVVAISLAHRLRWQASHGHRHADTQPLPAPSPRANDALCCCPRSSSRAVARRRRALRIWLSAPYRENVPRLFTLRLALARLCAGALRHLRR